MSLVAGTEIQLEAMGNQTNGPFTASAHFAAPLVESAAPTEIRDMPI
jgi:hypothetical protein